MTPQETKFILRVHRADGRYPAGDPLFAEALAETERAPELATWLTREHEFDETVANKIDAVQPPADLRATILAGARASRLQRRWWQQRRWLGMAASLAAAAAIPIAILLSRKPSLSAGAFAHLAVNEYATHRHNHEGPPELVALAAALSEHTAPLSTGLDVTTEKMRAAHCAAMTLGNHEAYEICFERDGAWFHLYVTKLDHAPGAKGNRRPIFLQQENISAAAWTDGTYLYSLVTRAGEEALAKVV